MISDQKTNAGLAVESEILPKIVESKENAISSLTWKARFWNNIITASFQLWADRFPTLWLLRFILYGKYISASIIKFLRRLAVFALWHIPSLSCFFCKNLLDIFNRHKFILYRKPPHLQISSTKLGRVRPMQLWILPKNESSIFAAWRCFQLSPQSKSLMPISSLFRFTLLYRIKMQQEKRGLTRISRPSFTAIRPS